MCHEIKNDYGITLLWVSNKNCKVVEYYDLLNKINYEKKYNFNSINELYESVNLMNNMSISNKNIQFGGYCIKFYNDDKTTFTIHLIKTDIYKYVISLINNYPNYSNKYKFFLKLYQNNTLSIVLQYFHKYPVDVIRRIHMSIKTLSLEILNIYHLTRKKQNTELYDILSIGYKKILYNLHKIYVQNKFTDTKKSFNKNDLFIEKKSINDIIVYDYLKQMNHDELVELFENRKILIDNLQKNNINHNNITLKYNLDIITLTELMFTN
jgi:hypothetical protein